MRLFRLLSLFSPNYLLTGVLYIVLSFVPAFLPARDYGFWGSLIFGAFYYLGIVYLGEYVVQRFTFVSLLSTIFGGRRSAWNFMVLGLLGSIPFSLLVSNLGNFWYFPYWTNVDYFVLGYVLFGWSFYALSIVFGYVMFKVLLDSLLPKHRISKKRYRFEPGMYKAFGVIGGWAAAMVFTMSMATTRWLTDYHYLANQPRDPYMFWYWWLIALFGWIVLCEYVIHKKRRSSLMSSTMHGYYVPLIAFVLIGITMGITNEIQNLPINLWGYANYPWQSMQIFDVPLFVIFAWPLHIIGIVEFYRAFGEEKLSSHFFDPPRKK